MKIVKYVDLGHVSDTIRCQYPNCKKKPFLRYLFFTDTNIIIGSSCKNKVEGIISKTRHTAKIKTNRHEKLNAPSLLDVYSEKSESHGVTPHSIWMEDKQRNEEEYL